VHDVEGCAAGGWCVHPQLKLVCQLLKLLHLQPQEHVVSMEHTKLQQTGISCVVSQSTSSSAC
jgi:hypothetical protein